MESLLSSSSKKTPTYKVGDGKYNGKENSMQGHHPGIQFFKPNQAPKWIANIRFFYSTEDPVNASADRPADSR